MKKRKTLSGIIGILCVIIVVCIVIFLLPQKTVQKTAILFSKDSGFYEKDVKLTMEANEDGASIYYTTDGTVPTEKSRKYEQAINIKDRSSQPNVLSANKGISFTGDYVPEKPIEKATVIRAFVKYKDGSQSKVFTKTYFVGKELAKKYKNIPVISLSIEPDDFFDNEKGIYIRGKVYDDWVANGGDEVNTPTWEMPANFTQKGRDWERRVHFEFFENGKPTALSQDLGVRALGGASRSVEQKSLKFFARKDYGKKDVTYELFPGNTKNNDQETPLNTYRTFAIRNGGNDSWMTKFRHRYISLLVSDRNYSKQQTRPVIVFINGEYWGIYTMQDDYSDNYIQDNYDIDKKNVVMIKLGAIEEGTKADQKLYDDFIDFAAKHDMSDDKNYKEICDMVDIDSLVDYFCTETYIVNGDWLCHDNNYRLWRARTTSNKPYEDGKWRYMLYDTEYSMGIYSGGKDYNINSIKDAMTMPEDCPGTQVTLFTSLMKNASFRQKFATTMMDLVNHNFTKERMNTLLDQVKGEYEPYMKDYFDRFGNTMDIEVPQPVDAFYHSIQELQLFINNRNIYIPKILKESLNLKGEAEDVTVKVNDTKGGTITINTITPDWKDGSFTGKYFSDYPITLTATPKDGYTFTGWGADADSTETTISIVPGKAKTIEANFAKQ